MVAPFVLEKFAEVNGRVEVFTDYGLYPYHSTIEPKDPPWYAVNGEPMLMGTSYSYLGLMHRPEVLEAAAAAGRTYGYGSHGSPILAGTTVLHRALEQRLATFLGAEDALLFSSGFVTNATIIAGLMGPGDLVVSDRQNHASILAGARFSGAQVGLYPHEDHEALEQLLIESAKAGTKTLVVIDAVFSMAGTIADLPRIAALCREHGAALMVDEAHSFGVLGETGRGVIEHFGMDPSLIDIRMGTLSKAIPSSGGYVAGDELLVRGLRHTTEGYIFSGALSPPLVAAALAGLEILIAEPHLPRELAAKAESVRSRLRAAGFVVPGEGTPIVPVVTTTEHEVLEIWLRALAAQVFVLPVVYPAVPRNAPRLRASITNDLLEDDLDLLVNAITGS